MQVDMAGYEGVNEGIRLYTSEGMPEDTQQVRQVTEGTQ